METTRITLRINETLDKELELQKQKTGLSKNTLIVQACQKMIDNYTKKSPQRKCKNDEGEEGRR